MPEAYLLKSAPSSNPHMPSPFIPLLYMYIDRCIYHHIPLYSHDMPTIYEIYYTSHFYQQKITYKSYKSPFFEWLNHPFPTFFLFIGDPKNGHPHRKIASLGPDPLPPVDSVFYFRVLGKAEKYSATGLAVSASAGGQCVKKTGCEWMLYL